MRQLALENGNEGNKAAAVDTINSWDEPIRQTFVFLLQLLDALTLKQDSNQVPLLEQ